MSEEQLSALLAKLKQDDGLREKLKGAADLDAAVAVAKNAGFDVSKDDLMEVQLSQADGELSDEELKGVAGGATVAGLVAGFDGVLQTDLPLQVGLIPFT